MSEDPNRLVMYSCEIVLLDLRTQNGGEYRVIGRHPTPEGARDMAMEEADKLFAAAQRLRGQVS